MAEFVIANNTKHPTERDVFVGREGEAPVENFTVYVNERLPKFGSLQVGREGVEPSRCHHRRILSPLRLPIPPSPQPVSILTHFLFFGIKISISVTGYNLIGGGDNQIWLENVPYLRIST